MSQTRQPRASNSLQTTTESRDPSITRLPVTLRLRAEEVPADTREEPSSSRRIRWSEDVVDNEGMGKKSSKGLFDPHSTPFQQPPPSPFFVLYRQQSNSHQYAVSTTRLDLLEKAAQKSPHPVRLITIVTAKMMDTPREQTELATHITGAATRTVITHPISMKDAALKLVTRSQKAGGESQVQMPTKRCLKGRRIRLRIAPGVPDLEVGFC